MLHLGGGWWLQVCSYGLICNLWSIVGPGCFQMFGHGRSSVGKGREVVLWRLAAAQSQAYKN